MDGHPGVTSQKTQRVTRGQEWGLAEGVVTRPTLGSAH